MTDHETLANPVLHTIEAADGWLLRVRDFAPRSESRTRGMIIAGHAMMVDSRTLCRPDRPTLTSVLVAAGFRVLVVDLRGHGESGPKPAQGGDWSFDELVTDLDHYVDLARTLDPELPMALVGHSVFAHACLAWLGQNRDSPILACVALSCSVWNRRLEPSRLIWWLKRILFLLTVGLTELVGYLPVRRLRAGTADEARSFWRQFHDHMRRNAWDSRDRRRDYFAGLATIEQPVLHLMSEGDKLYARPPACARLSATIPRRELLILGRDDAPGELARMRPTHMGMVTDPRSKLAWHWLAGWLERKLLRE